MAIFYGSSGADTVGTGVVGNAALADGAVTNSKILNATIAPAKLAQPLTLGVAQATTSGTSIDFVGIPAWVKRITLMFNGVSTNGTSNYLIQLGDAGGIETTGYLGASQDPAGASYSNFTNGIGVASALAANVWHGSIVISLVSSNNWTASYALARSNNNGGAFGAASKTLSDTLTQVRITTVNGTDLFDAGSVNILYE